MHPELLAGFLSAWVMIYVAAAAYSASAYARRSRDREALLFGLLALSLAVQNVALAGVGLSTDESGQLEAQTIATASFVVAVALLFHFVLQHARIERRREALAVVYGLAALFVGLTLGGYVHRFEAIPTDAASMVAVVGHVLVPEPLFAIPLVAFSVATGLLATAVLARAFFREHVEGFASLFGVVLFALSAAHDAAWAFGSPRPIALVPFGEAAFVLGVIVTLLWRYATLRRELERRATELNRRSKELARANDELRQTQAELVRKEQLAVVGELSAVVAHEVRNPLAIINNSVATLRRAGLEVADRDTLLNILDEESSRLNRLVGDLLRYARPIVVTRKHISVRDLVAQAMRIAEVRNDISVELVGDADIPRIWADPQLLRQVIENLVNNALQAMSSGGVLTLTLAARSGKSTPGVELSIEDTGEGMDTAVRSRAFDPFFTTKQTGTGLGLAIVARIIDAHGGKLTIQSAQGAGTAMHVFLPIASEEAAQQRMRSSDSAPPRSTPIPPMPPELLEALGPAQRDDS